MVRLIVAALLAAVSSPEAQSPSLRVYTDPVHGVTFRYPATWQPNFIRGFYLPVAILQQEKQTTAIGFSGPVAANDPADKTFAAAAHGPYRGSNLDGVFFAYLVLPYTTAAACRQRAASDEDNHDMGPLTIHGVTFRHIAGGSAGLGHSVTLEIYETDRKGLCFLFEADIHLENAGDAKPLTKAQQNVLRRQLTAVMESVTID